MTIAVNRNLSNCENSPKKRFEAPKIFFSGYFRNCLNCDSLRWSHTHFICIPAVHSISFSDQHFLAPILCNIFKKTCNILRIVVRSVLTMSTLVMSYRKHVVPVTELFFKQTALKYVGTSKSLLTYRPFCCPVSANIPVPSNS